MNNKEIINVFKYLIALSVSVLIIDHGVGRVFDSLLKKLPSEGERVAKSNYVLTQVKSDIVIIGSSRAECHYDSKVIHESIPTKSVFNCGVDGQLFFYELAVFNTILDRYNPDLIIWDVQVDELMQTKLPENLGLLYPYYSSSEYVHNYLNEREPRLKYMIWLNAYRFNATASRILRSVSFHDSNNMGFVGKQSADASRLIEHKIVKQEETILDRDKIELFKKAIIRANKQGVKIIIAQSPYYYKYDGESSTNKMVREICSQNDVTFIDDSQLSEFVGNNDLFYDVGHLRMGGAQLFTSYLLEQLRDEEIDILQNN